MPTQRSIGKEVDQDQGIVVPLELDGLRTLTQEVQTDGRIRVAVIIV